MSTDCKRCCIRRKPDHLTLSSMIVGNTPHIPQPGAGAASEIQIQTQTQPQTQIQKLPEGCTDCSDHSCACMAKQKLHMVENEHQKSNQ